MPVGRAAICLSRYILALQGRCLMCQRNNCFSSGSTPAANTHSRLRIHKSEKSAIGLGFKQTFITIRSLGVTKIEYSTLPVLMEVWLPISGQSEEISTKSSSTCGWIHPGSPHQPC